MAKEAFLVSADVRPTQDGGSFSKRSLVVPTLRQAIDRGIVLCGGRVSEFSRKNVREALEGEGIGPTNSYCGIMVVETYDDSRTTEAFNSFTVQKVESEL